MAISGKKFLNVTKARGLSITNHALRRIHQRGGEDLSRKEAAEVFMNARQIRPDKLRLLGYRPGYGRRKSNGEQSWYFRFTLRGSELIAVLTDEPGNRSFAWVTTYGRNAQTDQLAACSYKSLGCVA